MNNYLLHPDRDVAANYVAWIISAAELKWATDGKHGYYMTENFDDNVV